MKLGWPFFIFVAAEALFIGLFIGSITVTGVDPAHAPHGAIEYVTHRYQTLFAAAFALISAWVGVLAIRSQMLHAAELNTRTLLADKSDEMNTLFHLKRVADAHVLYSDNFSLETKPPLIDPPLRERVLRYCNPNALYAYTQMYEARSELQKRILMRDDIPTYLRLLNNAAVFCRDVAADQLEALERITGTTLVSYPSTPSSS